LLIFFSVRKDQTLFRWWNDPIKLINFHKYLYKWLLNKLLPDQISIFLPKNSLFDVENNLRIKRIYKLLNIIEWDPDDCTWSSVWLDAKNKIKFSPIFFLLFSKFRLHSKLTHISKMRAGLLKISNNMLSYFSQLPYLCCVCVQLLLIFHNIRILFIALYVINFNLVKVPGI